MKKNSLLHKTRKYLLLVFGFSLMTQIALSQDIESTKFSRHIGGGVTLTNNGISLLPTFTLGKPAAIFDLSVGGKKLSFDPQFRFALDGKPWAFIFWWRYKLLNNEKFRVQVGAHPSVLFRTVPVMTDGETTDILEALSYVAGEFSPNYMLTKNISIGMYYLYGHGFQENAVQNTHFLTINSSFSNIRLSEKFYMKFLPQIYYLRMDADDGFYITASLTLARRGFPLAIQSIVNQPFTTTLPGGDDFVWNISLIYSFNHEYARK